MSLLSGITNAVSNAWDSVTGAVDSVVESAQNTWDGTVQTVADTFSVPPPTWMMFSGTQPTSQLMASQMQSDRRRDEEFHQEREHRNVQVVEAQFSKSAQVRERKHQEHLASLAADGLMQAHTAQFTVNNREKVLEKAVSTSTPEPSVSVYAHRSPRADGSESGRASSGAAPVSPSQPAAAVDPGSISVGTGQSISVSSLMGQVHKA